MSAKTTASTSSAIVTRFVGKCPICEGEFKLTAGHSMVHHGYKRPGDGAIEGDCRAVGYDPYEISCEITKIYRNDMQSALASELSYLARLQAGEIASITVLEYVSFSVGKVSKTYSKGDDMFARALRTEIAQSESIITTVKREIARLTKLIDAWTLQPLRTVEEFEAPKAAAKAAAKADRAALKAEKLAKKIAFYQKRLDSAVAKRKGWAVADIFEAAQGSLRNDFGFTVENAISALDRNHVFTAFGFDVAAHYMTGINNSLRYAWYEFADASRPNPTWPASLV